MPKLKRREQLRKGKNPRGPEARARRWRVRMLVRSSGGSCRYCQCQVEREEITVDHVVPLSKGGLDVPESLALACAPCNREKGNGVALDLYLEGGQ